MSELTSAEQVDQLLEIAIKDTAPLPALEQLHHTLVQAHEKMHQPMRVAIVGLIKAGKSTVMNALLGEVVVATGTIETTFNVNWLRYAEKPSLIVHFKDNRSAEPRSFSDLSVLTRHSGQHLKYLRSIKYIEVFYPNELLRTLHLIDTPGLESVHQDDSQNTLDFINAHGHELTEATQVEASKADAVLYLFSQNIPASGEATVEEFQGPLMGAATPINSIGVLTMVDVYWPEAQDPLEAGYQVIARLQSNHPQVNRLLYSIAPVSGLLGLGAQTLTLPEFETLIELASLSESLLKRRLRDAESFEVKVFEDIPVAPERRQALLSRLGQYGIWRACQHIRAEVRDYQQLKHVLFAESGMPELRDMILSHFGSRAFLIKLDSMLQQIDTVVFWARQHAQDKDRDVLRKVERTIEALKTQQEGLSELRVLRTFYERRRSLNPLSLNPDEVQQLLQITGEHGTSYWQRLGIQEEENACTEVRLEKALSVAQELIRHWRQRARDRSMDRETSSAAQVLARAYEHIAYHIREAKKHLSLYT